MFPPAGSRPVLATVLLPRPARQQPPPRRPRPSPPPRPRQASSTKSVPGGRSRHVRGRGGFFAVLARSPKRHPPRSIGGSRAAAPATYLCRPRPGIAPAHGSLPIPRTQPKPSARHSPGADLRQRHPLTTLRGLPFPGRHGPEPPLGPCRPAIWWPSSPAALGPSPLWNRPRARCCLSGGGLRPGWSRARGPPGRGRRLALSQ